MVTAILTFVGTPTLTSTRFETLSVVEFLKPVLSPSQLQVSDSITVVEVLRAVLDPMLARVSDTVSVTEALQTLLLLPTELYSVVQDGISVTDAVALAATAIVHFVIGILKASDPYSNLQGSVRTPATAPSGGSVTAATGYGGRIERIGPDA